MNADNSFALDIVISYIGYPAAAHRLRDVYAWICPFHNEKTPSFYLYLNHGGSASYFCYGCHKQGGILDFEKRMKSRGQTPSRLDRAWSTHYEIRQGLRHDGLPVGHRPALPSISAILKHSERIKTRQYRAAARLWEEEQYKRTIEELTHRH